VERPAWNVKVARREGESEVTTMSVSGPCAIGDLTRARVLVAEPDATMRALIAETLMDEGYDVLEASSAVEILRLVERLRTEAFPYPGLDLLLIDNRLPGLSGLGVLRRLRGSAWAGPAVLMSALPAPHVHKVASWLHVPVLCVPFSLELLTAVVRAELLTPVVEDDLPPVANATMG
jgi:two-component system, response regulator, stage 0 sporulation protein F